MLSVHRLGYPRTTIALGVLTLLSAAAVVILLLAGMRLIDDGWPILLMVVAAVLLVATIVAARSDPDDVDETSPTPTDTQLLDSTSELRG